jgi:hypothetical protein
MFLACSNSELTSEIMNTFGYFDGTHHRVQNGSGAHPASYPMGTRALSPEVKRLEREADHSPPSSAKVKKWVELYLHSPNTPSCCGAQWKHRDNFTFTFTFTPLKVHWPITWPLPTT